MHILWLLRVPLSQTDCLLHGQRVTSRLSSARRIPSRAKGHSDKCYPSASVADLPGCLDLRCKSSDLEINSIHCKELFQQNRACQKRGYVDRVAVPAVPALGIPQLEPLFTQLSSRSVRAWVALSQRRGVSRRCGRAAASSRTFPDSQEEQRHA